MKKKVNLDQPTLDMFEPQDEWPKEYRKGFQLLKGTNYKIWGFDLETDGLNPYSKKYNIRTFALSPQAKLAFGQDMHTFNAFNEVALRNFLDDSEIILVGHNIKFDINWIRIKLNIDVKCMLFDTMFAQYLLDENIESNSLRYLTDTYLVRDEDIDLFGYKDQSGWDTPNRQDLLLYNCKDADASRRLYDVLVPKLKSNNFINLMTTSSLVLPVLSKMEVRGIYVDKEWAYKTQQRIIKELVSLRYTMATMVPIPFNPDSSKDLVKVFYSQRGMGLTPTKFTKGGEPSTDAEAINNLVDQNLSEQQMSFIDKILEYKKKTKLITTYYQPIEKWTRYDGRRHTSYSLGKFRNEEGFGGTVSGRLSSDMQQLPRDREVRGMFRATEGYELLDLDFSQLELRIAAFESQEPAMLDAFNNGLDIHSQVMSEITGIPYNEVIDGIKKDEKMKNQRVAFKEVNFGICYDMKPPRLQRTLRNKVGLKVDLEYCENTINAWLRRFSRLDNWIKKTKLEVVHRKEVTSFLGQKRRLPDASFNTSIGRHWIRSGLNFKIQSPAAWICLIGLRLLDDYFEDNREYFDGHILMQVHDSITSEIKFETDPLKYWQGNPRHRESILRDVKSIMEQDTVQYIKDVFGVHINVPLTIDIEYKERWS